MDKTSNLEQHDSLLQIAQSWHNWTKKHYQEDALLDSVIHVAKKVLRIREKAYQANLHFDLWDSYHSLGLYLKQKGRYNEAKVYLGKAVSIFEGLQHEQGVQSILELGKIYNLEGDYTEAQDYFKAVLKHAEYLCLNSMVQAAIVDLGAAYLGEQQDSLAIVFMEEYSHYFLDNKSKQDQNTGRFYNNLASAYLRNSKYEKAITTFQKARLYTQGSLETQAKIFINLSVAYRLHGAFKKCFEYLQLGKELANQGCNPEIIAFYHKSLAKYHESQEDLSAALEEYQRAITCMLPSFDPQNEFENPKGEDLEFIIVKTNLLSYLTDKLRLLKKLDGKKNKKEILELFKLGDLVIDKMRKDHFLEVTKLYWRSLVFPFYEEALEYCYLENDSDAAFYFFEKSKSVLLLEGYSFNTALSRITEKERNRYLELKAKFKKIEKESVLENLVNYTESYQNLRQYVDSLTLTYPNLFRSNQDLFVCSRKEFQNNHLRDSTSNYVHFFYGEQNVYALAVGKDRVVFKRLGSTMQIDMMVEEFKDFFRHPAKIENHFLSFQKSSYKLYQKVLDPLEISHQGRLVIIPDGELTSVPFESLICSFADSRNFSYLLERQVISYAFSGSMIGRTDNNQPKSTIDVVSFEPFDNTLEMEGVHFSGIDHVGFANAHNNGLRVKRFRGDAATKSNLFSLKESIPIIHFSSHAFDHTNGYPRLLFKDSVVSLEDLFTTCISADLVFLSACSTHLGAHAHGEGMQSIARGFTIAGAKSAISSLWNVVAAPNSEIVSGFYDNISLGQSKPMALHNAKLAYLKSDQVPSFEKSPYYWAGLVYYGDNEPIHFSSKSSWYHPCLPFISIFTLLGLFLLAIRKQY